ncbi:CaiB/BaiF CoA transferase family protein [Streptomyces mirabilis]|uniref:CaiB/BaiF CoA transferase family protein n=1 Tax=Streptomyces mirabilis TaxID=68239 RepID=UPI0033C80F07
MSPLPLDGITVVSIEQAVAAPFATRQLADLGARVIKVERPGTGDFARHYDESVHGQSSYFVWLNRSKESLTLDFKSDAGRLILGELLSQADVFVQNLAPGASTRLGLDAETLNATYPSLVVCDISGYGSGGSWSQRKAYDLLVQCETGLVSLTGTDTEVAKVGISVADIAAGMYAYSGILTALYTRATTGRAPAVAVALFDALAEWMGQPMYYTRYGGKQPQRVGAQHATIVPYGPFVAADGETVLLAVQNQREWVALCRHFLGDAGLAGDDRFATGAARVDQREQINEIVRRRFEELDSGKAMSLLDEAGIANASLNMVQGFLDHPVLSERQRWQDVEIPGATIAGLLPPANLSDVTPRMDPVPAIGQHNTSILAALGRSEKDINELHASGVI